MPELQFSDKAVTVEHERREAAEGCPQQLTVKFIVKNRARALWL